MVVGDLVTEVDVLVIGGGPGGYTAAIRAGQLGLNVTLVEKNSLGGVCLNEGCIPSKTLISKASEYHRLKSLSEQGIEIDNFKMNFEKFQHWKEKEVVSKLVQGIEVLCRKNKVEVINGEAVFIDDHQVRIMTEFGSQRYEFKHCIVATGSSPIELPQLKFGERIISSKEVLSLKEIPEKMIIVGGGYIGIELGTAFAKLGTKITILEAEEEILSVFDTDITSVIKRSLRELGVEIFTNTKITQSESSSNYVRLHVERDDKGKEMFEADYCLVTVGRKPNTEDIGLANAGVQVNEKKQIIVDSQGRTSNAKVFAIGDVVPGPQLAHKASYEGKVVAEVISGMDHVIDYISIPMVVFSEPEIATVGISEEQAKQLGHQVKVGKFPFSANGKALSLGNPTGFAKVIADDEHRLLGVQIVGRDASNLISEAALAIEFQANVEDISLTIHPHPTLAEALMEACDALLNKAIHITNG